MFGNLYHKVTEEMEQDHIAKRSKTSKCYYNETSNYIKKNSTVVDIS